MFRGNRSSTRGSSNFRGRGRRTDTRQSTQPKGVFADGIWHCDCNPRLPAEHFKVKKEGKNKGRWFYTCQKSDPHRCGFFLWDEDATPREEAAVLDGQRTEPGVQDGWNAGRSRASETNVTPRTHGMFANLGQTAAAREDDQSTASPSPPPSYSLEPPKTNGTKRPAQPAYLDDDEDDFDSWELTGEDERVLARTADAMALATPHKAQKTGVYATPATTGKRKLPWLEQAEDSAFAGPSEELLATPSKQPSNPFESLSPRTPSAHPTIATASTPSPPTRHRNALYNPADDASSLTSEVLASLSSVQIPPQTRENLRSILSKHDLKAQGFQKGRDISRLALKAKDAKIAELHARIASLEAEREMERGVARLRQRNAGGNEGSA